MEESGGTSQRDSRMRGLALGSGVTALVMAFVAAAYAFGLGRPDDVILILDGHQAGGPGERMAAAVVAVALGTFGVFCVSKWGRRDS